MAAAKPKSLIALTSFTCEVKGAPHLVRKDEVVAANHPAIKGREQLFEAYDPAKPAAA
jgi:hypothetical protein